MQYTSQLRAIFQILFDADNHKTNRDGASNYTMVEIIKTLCQENPQLPLLSKLGRAVNEVVSSDIPQIIKILNLHNRVVIPAGWSCRDDGSNHSIYIALERTDEDYSFAFFNLGDGADILQHSGTSHEDGPTIFSSGFKTPKILLIKAASLNTFLKSLLAPSNRDDPYLENFKSAKIYYDRLIKIMLAYLNPYYGSTYTITDQSTILDAHHPQRSGTCTYKSLAAALPAILPDLSAKPEEIHAIKTSLKIACLIFLKTASETNPSSQLSLDYEQACLRIAQRLIKPKSTGSQYFESWKNEFNKLQPSPHFFPKKPTKLQPADLLDFTVGVTDIPSDQPKRKYVNRSNPQIRFPNGDTPAAIINEFFSLEGIPSSAYFTKVIPAIKECLLSLHNAIHRVTQENLINQLSKLANSLSHISPKKNSSTSSCVEFSEHVINQIRLFLKCLKIAKSVIDHPKIRVYDTKKLHIYIFCIHIYARYLNKDVISEFNNRPKRLSEVSYLDPDLIEIQDLCHALCMRIINDYCPDDFDTADYVAGLAPITQFERNKFFAQIEKLRVNSDYYTYFSIENIFNGIKDFLIPFHKPSWRFGMKELDPYVASPTTKQLYKCGSVWHDAADNHDKKITSKKALSYVDTDGHYPAQRAAQELRYVITRDDKAGGILVKLAEFFLHTQVFQKETWDGCAQSENELYERQRFIWSAFIRDQHFQAAEADINSRDLNYLAETLSLKINESLTHNLHSHACHYLHGLALLIDRTPFNSKLYQHAIKASDYCQDHIIKATTPSDFLGMHTLLLARCSIKYIKSAAVNKDELTLRYLLSLVAYNYAGNRPTQAYPDSAILSYLHHSLLDCWSDICFATEVARDIRLHGNKVGISIPQEVPLSHADQSTITLIRKKFGISDDFQLTAGLVDPYSAPGAYTLSLTNKNRAESRIEIYPLGDIISPTQIACSLPNSILSTPTFQKLFPNPDHISDPVLQAGQYQFCYGEQKFFVIQNEDDIEVFHINECGTYCYRSDTERDPHLVFHNTTRWDIVSHNQHQTNTTPNVFNKQKIWQITLSLPLHIATTETFFKTQTGELFSTQMPLGTQPVTRIKKPNSNNWWASSVSISNQVIIKNRPSQDEHTKLGMQHNASPHALNFHFLHIGLSFTQKANGEDPRVFCDQYPTFFVSSQSDVTSYFSCKTSFNYYLTLSNGHEFLIIVPRLSLGELTKTNLCEMRFNKPNAELADITIFTTNDNGKLLPRYHVFKWNQHLNQPATGNLDAQYHLIFILAMYDSSGEGIKAAIQYFDDNISPGKYDACSNSMIADILESELSHPEMGALKRRISFSLNRNPLFLSSEESSEQNLQTYLKPFQIQCLPRTRPKKSLSKGIKIQINQQTSQINLYLSESEPTSLSVKRIRSATPLSITNITIPGMDNELAPAHSLAAMSYPKLDFESMQWLCSDPSEKQKPAEWLWQRIGIDPDPFDNEKCKSKEISFPVARLEKADKSIQIRTSEMQDIPLLERVNLPNYIERYIPHHSEKSSIPIEIKPVDVASTSLEEMITIGIEDAQKEQRIDQKPIADQSVTENATKAISEAVSNIYKDADQIPLASEKFISPQAHSFKRFLQCLSRPIEEAKSLIGADDPSYQTLKTLMSAWLWHKTESQALDRKTYQAREYSFNHPHAYLLLLLEFTENIRLRKSQLHLINHLCEPEGDKFPARLAEAIMGDGKTTIAGTLALARAQTLTKQVSFLELPEAIFNQQSKDIHNQLRRIYGIDTLILTFAREDHQSELEPWDAILNKLQTAQNRQIPVLTTAQTLAAIANTHKELLFQSTHSEKINSVLKIIKKASKITDEYDSVFGSTPLVYSLDHAPYQSRTDDKNRFTHEQVQILSLIFPALFSVYQSKSEKTSQSDYDHQIKENFIQKLLDGEKSQVGLMKMAKRLKLDVDVIKKLLKDPDCMSKIEEVIWTKATSGTDQQKSSYITAIKWTHRFVHQIIPEALAIDPNLSYGLDPQKPHCKTIIPYSNGVPNSGSRFENPLLTLTLTVIQSYRDGFSLKQFKELMLVLIENHHKACLQQGIGNPTTLLTKLIPQGHYKAFYEGLTLLQASDLNALLSAKISTLYDELLPHHMLNICWAVIHTQVIPKITYNTTKIRHSWPSAQSESGFTGTTHDMEKFFNIEAPRSRIIDGRTLNTLLEIELQGKNCQFYTHTVAANIIGYCKEKPNTRAVIDVGDLLKAHLPNHSMHDYVKQNQHGIYEATGCQAIFYFEKGDFFALKKGALSPIALSHFNEDYIYMQVNIPIEQRFWFFSARFCRGVDAKLDPKGEVLTMICEDNSLASVLQGIKRARLLGVNQQEPSFVLAKDFMEKFAIEGSASTSKHFLQLAKKQNGEPLSIDAIWRHIIQRDSAKLKTDLYARTVDYIEAIYIDTLDEYFLNRHIRTLKDHEKKVLSQFFSTKSLTPEELINVEKVTQSTLDALIAVARIFHNRYQEFYQSCISRGPLKAPSELKKEAEKIIGEKQEKLPEEIELFGYTTNEAVNEKEQQQQIQIEQAQRQEHAAKNPPKADQVYYSLDPKPLSSIGLLDIHESFLISQNYRSVCTQHDQNKKLLHRAVAVMLTQEDTKSSTYPKKPFILLDATDYGLYQKGKLMIPDEIMTAKPDVVILSQLPDRLINSPSICSVGHRTNLLASMLLSGNIAWLNDVNLATPHHPLRELRDDLLEFKATDACKKLVECTRTSYAHLSQTGRKSITSLMSAGTELPKKSLEKLTLLVQARKARSSTLNKFANKIIGFFKRTNEKLNYIKRIKLSKEKMASARALVNKASSALKGLSKLTISTQLISLALAVYALLVNSHVILYAACAVTLFATINDIRYRIRQIDLTNQVNAKSWSTTFKILCNNLFTFDIFRSRKAVLQYQTPRLLKIYKEFDSMLKFLIIPILCGTYLLGYQIPAYYLIASIIVSISLAILKSWKMNADFDHWQKEKSSVQKSGYKTPQKDYIQVAASAIPGMYVPHAHKTRPSTQQLLRLKYQLSSRIQDLTTVLDHLDACKAHGVSLGLNIAANNQSFPHLTQNFIKLVAHFLANRPEKTIDQYHRLLSILLLARENNIYPTIKLSRTLNTELRRAYRSIERAFPSKRTTNHLFECLIKDALSPVCDNKAPNRDDIIHLFTEIRQFAKQQQASLIIACLEYTKAHRIDIKLPAELNTPEFYQWLNSALRLLCKTRQQSRQYLASLFTIENQAQPKTSPLASKALKFKKKTLRKLQQSQYRVIQDKENTGQQNFVRIEKQDMYLQAESSGDENEYQLNYFTCSHAIHALSKVRASIQNKIITEKVLLQMMSDLLKLRQDPKVQTNKILNYLQKLDKIGSLPDTFKVSHDGTGHTIIEAVLTDTSKVRDIHYAQDLNQNKSHLNQVIDQEIEKLEHMSYLIDASPKQLDEVIFTPSSN